MRPRRYPERDFRVERLEAIIRAQRAGLLLCLLVIFVLSVAVVTARRGGSARGIFIGGKLAVLVRDKRAAEKVRERLLKEAKGDLPGNAAFKQDWADETCRVEGQPVLSVEEAVRKLRPRLTVLVAGTALRANRQDLVVLATRELAEAARDKFLHSYVEKVKDDNTVTQVKTRQKIELADVEVPPEQILTDVGTAVKVLRAAAPKITVVVVTEGTRDVPYKVKDEERESQVLPKGTRRRVRTGEPGVKRIHERYVYENGELVRTDKLSVEIVREARPGLVLVGTGEATP